jgi:ketosteroid isomerase-like protein
MTPTSDYVREVFKGLETGSGGAFFEHVADDVDWTVMGTHPLAGHYRSKRAFQEATFGKLSNRAQWHALRQPLLLGGALRRGPHR